MSRQLADLRLAVMMLELKSRIMIVALGITTGSRMSGTNFSLHSMTRTHMSTALPIIRSFALIMPDSPPGRASL